MIKIKCVAIKHKLNKMMNNISKQLINLYNNQISLLGDGTLINLLSLLFQLIPDDNDDDNDDDDDDNDDDDDDDDDNKDDKKNNNDKIPKINIDKNDLIDKIIHDILSLIDDKEIVNYKNNAEILNFAQFLIKLLSKSSLQINNNINLKTVKLSASTEYVIVTKLFIVLSKKSIKNDKIIAQIQNENDNELAGMIIQIMSKSDDNKNNLNKKKPKAVQMVSSKKDFNPKLTVKAPLISAYNADVFKKCMDSIAIDKFMYFYKKCVDYKEKEKYPILTKLSQQIDLFWNIDKLLDISSWIRLVHSKYQGTLTVTSCNKVKIEDVFGHIKLNKWGDIREWKIQYNKFKKTINNISDSDLNKTINKLSSSNQKVSISSSLISKYSGNKTIENNLKIIKKIIKLQNKFLNEIPNFDAISKNVKFFDLKKENLINNENIINILSSNGKPWICYDAGNVLQAETYLIFDLERIELEILNKCILGRNKLRIKYSNFEFVGSKNMLQLIQKLKIKQEILSYEVWHSFDKQFESNIQRKKALIIIEDVISLLSSSKKNNIKNLNINNNNNNNNNNMLSVNTQNVSTRQRQKSKFGDFFKKKKWFKKNKNKKNQKIIKQNIDNYLNVNDDNNDNKKDDNDVNDDNDDDKDDNKNNSDDEYDDDDDSDDDNDDLKDDQKQSSSIKLAKKRIFYSSNHNSNQELWKFMKYKLKLNSEKYNLFKLNSLKDNNDNDNDNDDNKIQLKHIQSIWNELIKRIEGEMIHYSDQCYICFENIEFDNMTPIELECCSLKLHYECLKEYVSSKFMNDGRRITLKQLSCLMCKRQMKHKMAYKLFEPINILYEKVKKLGINRLKLDDKFSDIQITNKNGVFYNNPAGFAMKIYSFFICYKCKNPYYGGLNDCGGALEDNIDPSERLCSQCGKPQDFETKCIKHGEEYIQWKCRYCCMLATFYCFGTTHFCESCHCVPYQLRDKPKNDLIQCPCKSNLKTHYPEKVKGNCPLGVVHPPSGEEYCLGCAWCRKDKHP